MGDSLYLIDTQISALPDNLTVGGNLDLSGTPITALPDNLTVGGWLDLSGTPITALPDNLTVGGWLNLSDTPITALPDNLTVGGWIDLTGTQIPAQASKKVKKLCDGDYVENKYLYADGILTHVKGRRKVGKYTFYIGKIRGKNVVSDGVHYAHCDKLRDGVADLMFKTAQDRGAAQYAGMSMDAELTVEDAVTMYRVITGACRQGSEAFVRSLKNLKRTYTLRECIELTRGQYGAEAFARFFKDGSAQS